MKLVPLSQGKYAMVDDEEFERLSKFTWHYNEKKEEFWLCPKK
jgi:hypothetical protein